MQIKKINHEFSVCQVEDYSFVNIDSEYCFIEKTDEEKSLVCLTNSVFQVADILQTSLPSFYQ